MEHTKNESLGSDFTVSSLNFGGANYVLADSSITASPISDLTTAL